MLCTKNISECINRLANQAAHESTTATEAMQFAQAAQNLGQAAMSLTNLPTLIAEPKADVESTYRNRHNMCYNLAASLISNSIPKIDATQCVRTLNKTFNTPLSDEKLNTIIHLVYK